MSIGKLYQPFQPPSSTTIAFRTVICIDYQRVKVKLLLPFRYHLVKTISDKIRCHLTLTEPQVALAGGRKQYSKRSKCSVGMEIVVTGLCALPIVSSTGKRSYFHCCLGVQRYPQDTLLLVGGFADKVNFFEDCVGFRNFFYGRHFLTLRNRYPRSLSLLRNVLSQGNSEFLYPKRPISR